MINILLIEDEEFDVRRVKNTLDYNNEDITIKEVVSNGKAALEFISDDSSNFDIIIMDYQISGGLHGEQLIRKIKEIDSTIEIIVITKMTIDVSDYKFANNLVEAGAYWYCTKYPGNIDEYIYQPTDFLLAIKNANKKRQLEQKISKSDKKNKKNIQNLLYQKKIIGNSTEVEKLKKNITKFAKSNVSILISGPSGVGKELVAQNIHLNSSRKLEEFVAINCGSIPEDLIESELFGYEKGAFTGAVSGKSGLFEVANNGTLFLDEIAELPKLAQVKLLRVLQEGEIEKIGRTSSINVDVRIIAATNKNLETEVAEGRFREDLFYRLNVVPLEVVPLKKRQSDIILLFNYFLEFFCADFDVPVPTVSKDAEKQLIQYDWPGNVRQLKNVVQRVIFNCEGIVDSEVVKKSILRKADNKQNIIDLFEQLDDGNIISLNDFDKRMKKDYLLYVRSRVESNAEAARKLGLAPSNHHRMCKELGII